MLLEERNTELESLRRELAELKKTNMANWEARRIQEEISKVTDGELHGSVFIVTEGRENIKLALVRVNLYEAADAKQKLAGLNRQLIQNASEIRQRAQTALETVEKLRKEYEPAKADYASKLKAFEEARGELIRRFNALGGLAYLTEFGWREPQYYEEADGPVLTKEKRSIYNFYRRDVDSVEQELNAAADHAVKKQADLIDAITVYNQACTAFTALAENYHNLCFLSVGNPLKSTKTDADGKFTMRIPRQGSFVLAAIASRSVGKKTENYVWLIEVSLNASDTLHYFLSNDNLATANSPDSVIEPLNIGTLSHLSSEFSSFVSFGSFRRKTEKETLSGLAQVYASMPPPSAVQILNGMEVDDIAAILIFMNEKDQEAILLNFATNSLTKDSRKANDIRERIRKRK